MSNWQILADEIQQWSSPVQFWWRDDDAVANSGALQRLLMLADQFSIPVHLAVIPDSLQTSLSVINKAQHRANCYVLQHGYDHQNYALEGQRKIELGGSQPLPELLHKLAQGQKILKSQFGEQYLNILVPPWNRIADEVARELPDMGYTQLSVLGTKEQVETDFNVNVHIDIIDWKRRCFAGEELILTNMISHLRNKRLASLSGNIKPCGLMTHHLKHDLNCWLFISKFFQFCQRHENIEWLGGQQLHQFVNAS
ncbi:polysaccharide deacetylase family protein [Moritella yayanosii]|uniref:Polysaccharide deacetylase n=1 Tax=Moritella yayanosii TaxID=69539 RepID=A0A330LN75_9GAMM|nr:polysaccharide deacetylase family protein [Moritella yayanosii]SQD78143.1 conserved protein of unknown function [Moritella yayanosii]